MRVIAGKYKSRQLKAVKSDLTRPTTDRNKENLFNIIGPFFQGGTVLDLFGGSGALGIEAMSRGCDYLYSVDSQLLAFKTIQENLSLLKIENSKALKMDFKKALSYVKQQEIIFDYIFLDPPYGKGLSVQAINIILQENLLQEDALLIVEESKEVQFEEHACLTCIKEVNYGITSVHVYRYNKGVA